MAHTIANASAELLAELNAECGMPRTPEGGTVECEWVAAGDGSVWIPDRLPRRDMRQYWADPSWASSTASPVDRLTEIQNLIDTATASGQDHEVYFPRGASGNPYHVSNGVDASGDGGAHINAARGAVLRSMSSTPSENRAVLRYTNATRGSVRNLTVTANGNDGYAFREQHNGEIYLQDVTFNNGTVTPFLSDDSVLLFERVKCNAPAVGAGNTPTSRAAIFLAHNYCQGTHLQLNRGTASLLYVGRSSGYTRNTLGAALGLSGGIPAPTPLDGDALLSAAGSTIINAFWSEPEVDGVTVVPLQRCLDLRGTNMLRINLVYTEGCLVTLYAGNSARGIHVNGIRNATGGETYDLESIAASTIRGAKGSSTSKVRVKAMGTGLTDPAAILAARGVIVEAHWDSDVSPTTVITKELWE